MRARWRIEERYKTKESEREQQRCRMEGKKKCNETKSQKIDEQHNNRNIEMLTPRETISKMSE